MASEWRDTTLGEFVRLQRGHDLTETDRRPGQVPIMGSAGQNGFHDTAKSTGPGVVIGRSGVGSMGVVTYCAAEYWPHNTVLYVTDFLGNDERFTYYFLRHLNLRRFDSGSAQASLNRNYIYPIRIHVPHPAEQRAIAHILGTLDDKIELNRRMNETLEAIARALFKSWFVEKVQAGPGYGWHDGKMHELVTLSRDAVSPGEFPNETFDHYSISAFDEGGLAKAERGEQILSNKFLVTSDAIMISKLNPRIRRVWLPRINNSTRSVSSTEFLVAVPREGTSREWLYGLFSSDAFLEKFATFVTGTSGSHQRVKPEYLLAMDVDIPPQERMNGYAVQARPLYDRIALNRKESHSLASLRDTLLPKIISGELRVKNAEKMMAAMT